MFCMHQISPKSFCGLVPLGLLCLAVLVPALKAQGKAQKQVFPSAEEMLAYHGDTAEILRLLKGGFDVNHVERDGGTLLTYAVAGNQPALVKLLLAKGADPNADMGASMLGAAGLDNVEMLRYLLAAGGNPNAHYDVDSDTPLIVACQEGTIAAVKLLLQNGADPNGANNMSFSPLMMVVSGPGGKAEARVLIKNGADVNAKDKYGMTPLMYAAFWGQLDDVRLLLKAGADPTLKDNTNLTATKYAKRGGFKEVVKVLRQAEVQRSRK